MQRLESWRHRGAAWRTRRPRVGIYTMASSNCIWMLSVLISLMTSDFGVSGRAVDTKGFLSQSSKTAHKSPEPTLRTDASRHWRHAETHRERCADLVAPWLENTQQAPGGDDDNGTLLQLRVRPFSAGQSRGLVYPGRPLFNFVRRVYRCCQEGVNCRNIKGIQGRSRADADAEFILTKEVLSLTVRRAELHLQLLNPQHLDIRPMLPFMAKHNLPTRFSLGSQGDTLELRVDLQFLFHRLQQVVGGPGRSTSLVNMRRVAFFSNGDPPGEQPSLGDGVANAVPDLDLGLVLSCSRAGSEVSCGDGGVHLSHTPFIALYYR